MAAGDAATSAGTAASGDTALPGVWRGSTQREAVGETWTMQDPMHRSLGGSSVLLKGLEPYGALAWPVAHTLALTALQNPISREIEAASTNKLL